MNITSRTYFAALSLLSGALVVLSVILHQAAERFGLGDGTTFALYLLSAICAISVAGWTWNCIDERGLLIGIMRPLVRISTFGLCTLFLGFGISCFKVWPLVAMCLIWTGAGIAMPTGLAYVLLSFLKKEPPVVTTG